MSITRLPSFTSCHLWLVDLDAAPAPHAVACLSESEWERARRFVFRRDRNRFVAAHAALREILSAQSGVPAAMLEFSLGGFGKPTVVEPAGVRFNLSHSQSLALIAIDEEAEVGIDVELLRPMHDAEALAASYFSPAERQALEAVEPAARDRAFLTCWTRKEACLKATGLGLSVDTRSFEVGLSPDTREVIVPCGEDAARLTVSSFDHVQGALCAVSRVLAYEPVDPPARPVAESELFA